MEVPVENCFAEGDTLRIFAAFLHRQKLDTLDYRSLRTGWSWTRHHTTRDRRTDRYDDTSLGRYDAL